MTFPAKPLVPTEQVSHRIPDVIRVKIAEAIIGTFETVSWTLRPSARGCIFSTLHGQGADPAVLQGTNPAVGKRYFMVWSPWARWKG